MIAFRSLLPWAAATLSLAVLLSIAIPASAATDDTPAAPATTDDGQFKDLIQNSPFLRPLNLANSLVVTGLADVEGETLATIYDKEEKATTLVTDAAGNERGMRILGIMRDRRRNEVALKVSVRGAEVQIPFDVDALLPRRDANNPRQGDGRDRGDGRRGGDRGDRRGGSPPPKQIMDKYNSLSGEQRGAYWRWANEYYRKNPELRNSDERYPAVEKALDAIKSGRRPPD